MVLETSKEIIFDQILYISYLLYFWKDISDIKDFINLSSEYNVMISAYVAKLNLKVGYTNVEVCFWFYFILAKEVKIKDK